MKKTLTTLLLISGLILIAGCASTKKTVINNPTIGEQISGYEAQVSGLESQTTENPVIKQTAEDSGCADLYKKIDNEIVSANYCKVDADCSVLILGGIYVEFGCYHFINKNVDQQQFYDEMQVYNKKCSKIVDRCVPSPEPTCVSNKCVYVK